MKAYLLRIALIMLACGLPSQALADLVNVHISLEGGPNGKGVAISRGLDCFVLTAAHVVEEPLPILVTGKNRKNSAAEVFKFMPTVDLAVLKLENPAEICGPDAYFSVNDLEQRLSRNRLGRLSFLTEDGEVYEEDVRLISADSDYIDIESFSGGLELGESLSGSLLYVAGQPVGILVEVYTGHPSRRQLRPPRHLQRSQGRIYRIDRIHEQIGSFLPLVVPFEEQARYDSQLAADMLRKHINYMQTHEFCLSLWRLPKWVAKPKIGTYFHDIRRQGALGKDEYLIKSMLFPGVHSVYTPGKHRHAVTTVGFVSSSAELGGIWRAAEQAINECILSDVRKEVGKIRIRSHMRRDDVRKATMWTLERTGKWGWALNDVDIRLTYGASRAIELRIWTID